MNAGGDWIQIESYGAATSAGASVTAARGTVPHSGNGSGAARRSYPQLLQYPRPMRRDRRTAASSQPIGSRAAIVANPQGGAPTPVKLNGDPPRRTEKPATSNTFSASGPIAAPAGVAAW